MTTAAPAEDAAAVVAGHRRAAILTADGELLALTCEQAAATLRGPTRSRAAPLLVHAPATLRRLGLRPQPCLDLLELWAFVLPARPVTPTPRGLALALDLDPPADLEAAAAMLPRIASALLGRLAAGRALPINEEAAGLARRMGEHGWPWAQTVAEALGSASPASPDALRVWKRLPEWEDTAPRPAPGSSPVPPADSRARLARMLGPHAEQRPGQADYAAAAAAAFAPREVRGDPHVVLAEAGTGTGKTLGYVAPASLWAERNGGAVWISTYTRHLQRQIDAELARLHPDAAERRRRVVVRKGRENYLCLLNMEDAVNASLAGSGIPGPFAHAGAGTIPLALLARWALATNDGDLNGGDLPGWFAELFGPGAATGLADRRGECIHGACPHYKTCFVEHTIRRARTADLVVANHALVMAQAAWAYAASIQAAPAHATSGSQGGDAGDETLPTRYVFDEGHHVFAAADGAFSAELSGLEAAELRRWLLGAEGGRSRARGLRRRLDDLVSGRPALEAPLDAALLAAKALPAPGWSLRLAEDDPALDAPAAADTAAGARPGTPGAGPASPAPTLASAAPPAIEPAALSGAPADNPAEAFLRLLRRQILARIAGGPDADRAGFAPALFAPECDLHPVSEPLARAAERLERALGRIAEPLRTLQQRLVARLEDEAEELDPTTRGRIEAMSRTLRRRAAGRLDAWRAMLRATVEAPPAPGARPEHVHLLRLDRRRPAGTRGSDGASLPGLAAPSRGPPDRSLLDRDVGLHRHWLDPTIPFAATLAAPAHGLLITSATLRDAPEQAAAETVWAAAEARVGATHLPSPPLRATVASPFDYAAQTRCFVVNDLMPGDLGALAGAYRALFLASGGGGLGLFTAISRLRAVHERIAPALEESGVTLLAQHVDAMDNATLIDVFRSEEHSCLLGTDAMRDGVDVPGRALRLVVFERVPWPRPDILHRERRTHLSGGDTTGYDDREARLRLRQAFGRLIRVAGDRGVFVLLDRRTPTRLLSAFPPGVAVQRAGLAETVAGVKAFLDPG
jgi:ATP-dependent DNA helicase DinG